MKIVVSLLVAAGAVLLLLAWSGVRGGDFVDAYAAIDGRGFAAFLGLQALVYVLRGLRLRSLVHAVGHVPIPRLDASRAVAAATAWTFDGQVLPARIGEASLVLHLGRLGVKGSVGVMALLVSRVLDLVVLALVFGTACLVAGLAEALPRPRVLVGLGAASLLGALFLFVAVVRGGTLLGIARKIVARLGLERSALGTKLLGTVGRVEDAFHALSHADFRRAFLWTLPLTASIFAAYVALGGAAGLGGLGTLGWVFGTSCAMIGGLVPISGFLGVGAFDVAFAAGFAFVGVPREDATTGGLVFHTMYLLGVCLYGIVAHAVLARVARGAADGTHGNR